MRVLALLTCLGVQVDPRTGQKVIAGPFDLLQGPKPVTMGFVIYARLECAKGKQAVTLQMRRQGQAPGMAVECKFDVVSKYEEGQYELVVPIGPVTFHEESRYVVEVVESGVVIGSTWFIIEEKAVLFLPGKNGALIPTEGVAGRR